LFEENPIDGHGEELAAERPQPQMEQQQPNQQNFLACQAESVFSGKSTDSDSSFVESNGSSEADYISEEESVHESEASRYSERSDSDSDISSDSGDEQFEVYDGCSFSVDEAVLDLFSNNLDNFQTRKSLGDSLKTFLKYLPKHNNMPKTLTQLLNYVE